MKGKFESRRQKSETSFHGSEQYHQGKTYKEDTKAVQGLTPEELSVSEHKVTRQILWW